MPRSFDRIFVHCSATNYGNVLEIDKWHRARGWSKIGYHFVISNGKPFQSMERPWGFMVGAIEAGRQLDDDEVHETEEVGAHVYGLNLGAVGICLIGREKFHESQIVRLRYLISELQGKLNIPKGEIYGHYEAGTLDPRYTTSKTCPNIPCDRLRAFMADDISLPGLMAAIRHRTAEIYGEEG